MTKRPAHRPKGSPSRRSVRRVLAKDRTNGEIVPDDEVRRRPIYKAYARMLALAEDVDRELALAIAAKPQDPAEIKDCRERLRTVLKDLIPYEKPRLTAMKVSGDKKAPLFDLSGLAEKELLLMRRIILKAKQVDEHQESEEDDAESE
jgi:hypothetical protein